MIWDRHAGQIRGLLSGIKKTKIEVLLPHIQEAYREDAYHSLSIEGYQVTEELIQKVASGEWNPNDANGDKSERNALAAKGYHRAFFSINQLLHEHHNENPGAVLEDNLQDVFFSTL